MCSRGLDGRAVSKRALSLAPEVEPEVLLDACPVPPRRFWWKAPFEWSPDGDTLLASCGAEQLWRIRDGEAPVLLESDPTDSAIAWDRSGRYVLRRAGPYGSDVRGWQLIDVETGRQSPLPVRTRDETAQGLAWASEI